MPPATATSEPSPTIEPTRSYPLLQGTPLPELSTKIEKDNLEHLSPVARFGDGVFLGKQVSMDSKMFALVTTAGVSIYDSQTLSLSRRIETTILPDNPQNSSNYYDEINFALSPDFRRFAATRKDHVDVWDVENGQIVQRLTIPDRWDSTNLVFAAGGEVLIASLGGADSGIFAWRISDGVLLAQSEDWKYGLSPDGTILLMEDTEKYETINEFQLPEGKILTSLAAPSIFSYPAGYSFTNDSRRLAVIYQDGNVDILDVGAAQPVKRISVPGTGNYPYQTNYFEANDGLFVASGDNLILWDTTTWRQIAQYPETDEHHVSSDGKRLVIVSATPKGDPRKMGTRYAYSVDIWDIAAGKKFQQYEWEDDVALDLKNWFSPKTNIWAMGSSSGTVIIQCDQTDGFWRIPGEMQPQWMEEGKVLVTVNEQGVSVWDVQKRSTILTADGFDPILLPASNKLITQEFGLMRLYDLTSGEKVVEQHLLSPANQASFSLDGKTLSKANDAEDLRAAQYGKRWAAKAQGNQLLSLSNLKSVKTFPPYTVFSPDHTLAVFVGSDTIDIRRASNEQSMLKIPSENIYTLAVSPDNHLLAVVRYMTGLSIYSIPDGKEILRQKNAFGSHLKFSPDGQRLYAMHLDFQDRIGTIKGLDIASGQWLQFANFDTCMEIDGDTECFLGRAYALSADGHRMVYAGKNNAISIVQTADRKTLTTINMPRMETFSLAISPDNKLLAAALQNGHIYMVDMESGEVMKEIVSPTFSENGPLTMYVSFSPDGKILSVSDLGKVELWAVQSETWK